MRARLGVLQMTLQRHITNLGRNITKFWSITILQVCKKNVMSKNVIFIGFISIYYNITKNTIKVLLNREYRGIRGKYTCLNPLYTQIALGIYACAREGFLDFRRSFDGRLGFWFGGQIGMVQISAGVVMSPQRPRPWPLPRAMNRFHLCDEFHSCLGFGGVKCGKGTSRGG